MQPSLRSRVLPVAVATAALLALATAPTTAVEGPFKVLGGPQDQRLSAANATYLTWTESTLAHPDRFHAFARVRGTTETFRLDPIGSRGYTGGIDPDQHRAIYQRITGQTSDLFFVNLETRGQSKLPGVVNTAKWERDPRVSNRFVLFARDTAKQTTVWLWERGTTTVERIAAHDFTRYHVEAGAVGERYATWSVCGPLSCRAWIHDTELGTSKKIPAPDGLARYAPAVDEVEEQVYFVRSGQRCGANVRIMRVPIGNLGAAPVPLLALPAGIDVGFTLSIARVSERTDLWFARFRCGPQQGDIYRLRDVGVG